MALQTFKQLHQQDTPLLISNVWDVASAKLAEKHGYQAIGTSSAAIAHSLGYEDGEALSFEELLYLVKRIKRSTHIPLTVDLESGYANDAQTLVENCLRLSKLGVSGINLEDSTVRNGQREINPMADFAQQLTFLKQQLLENNGELFINARTDTYLLDIPNTQQATKERIHAYTQAGADGIFIPCIQAPTDIALAVKATELPINVMCMPQLSTFSELSALGVKRISMGDFVFNSLQTTLSHTLEDIKTHQSFQPLF